MFLLFFSKYWRHILDALLLVAVIVFVFLWNPFNIFGKGLRLQRTSNLVSSVRSIGQLVSAEYYGEVMASLNEAQLNQIEEKDLEARAEAAYFDLKKQAFEQITASLLSRYSKADLEKGDKKINRKAEKLLKSALGASLDRYNSWNNSLFREDTADVVLLFFGKYISNAQVDEGRYKRGKRRDELRKDQMANLLSFVTQKYSSLSEEQFTDFLNQGFETTADYADFHYSFMGLQRSRKEQKKELAMIGRGWVKAGFDFGTLDERHVRFDQETRTIHLVGMSPQILDTDINPWFIPELKVKGYEIIAADHVNFEDAMLVKGYCKRKLEKNALDAKILDHAQEYGEFAFKEFFSLLTGEEIRAVLFHTDVFSQVLDQIQSDNVITIDELPLIDSTITKHLNSMADLDVDDAYAQQQKELLTDFIRSLKNLPLVSKKTNMEFNYFTKNLPVVLIDSLIDQSEYDLLKNTLRWQIKQEGAFVPSEYHELDYWFGDSLAFVREYNTLIRELLALCDTTLYTLKDSTYVLNSDPEQRAEMERLEKIKGTKANQVLRYSVADSIFYVVYVQDLAQIDLRELYYNFQIINPDTLVEYFKRPEFDLSADSLKLFPQDFVETQTQKLERETYADFLSQQYQSYQERGFIVKASDAVRDKVLNRQKIKQAGQDLKATMNSIKQSVTR